MCEDEEEREGDFLIFFSFLRFFLRFTEIELVGFYRSRRQSWTMRRELRVGTKILTFQQTSTGRKFSYLCYFKPKGHVIVTPQIPGVR